MLADHPVLSLAELELHDPRPTGHGAERRFLCPFPACADHQRHEHKNLAANIETGLWACKRCGASGRLTEKWERREPRARALRVGPYEKARRAMGLGSSLAGLAPVHRGGVASTSAVHAADGRTPPIARSDQDDHHAAGTPQTMPSWRRRWDQAVPVAGTPGETYLASRGIPIDLATAAGVRYLERWDHWTRDEGGDWHLLGTSRRVVFPIVDKTGEAIGIQGRKIAAADYGEKMLTNGRGGIFVAGTAWPLEQTERVAIVEAPIDALSLAAVGIPALATQGTSCPDWLPLALAFKTVLLGHDNDAPDAYGQRAGDMAAAGLIPALRSYGAEPQRWRPAAKDWNQDLEDLGLEQLRGRVAGDNEPIEPTNDVAETAAVVEHAPLPGDRIGSLAPVLLAEAKAECCPRDEPVDLSERAEVDELLRWLDAADLPQEPFQLWPWLKVLDVARFIATLQTELSSDAAGARWRAAAENLRQFARLNRGVDVGEARRSPHQEGRAPPRARTGANQPVAHVLPLIGLHVR